eukprot:1253279-Rhodomonas_salina.1
MEQRAGRESAYRDRESVFDKGSSHGGCEERTAGIATRARSGPSFLPTRFCPKSTHDSRKPSAAELVYQYAPTNIHTMATMRLVAAKLTSVSETADRVAM